MEVRNTSPLLNQTSAQGELKKLREATQEFEQIFANMMLKEMYKGVGKSGFLDGGDYEKMFKDMLVQERAKQLTSAGGLGLADKMFSQLKRFVAPGGAVPGESTSSPLSPTKKDPLAMLQEMNLERITHDYRNTQGNQKQ